MRLKEIRENSLLKQYNISKILGVARGTYSLWELELDIIPIKRLNDFCNYFQCSIDYALGLTEDKNYLNERKEINLKLSGNRLKDIRKKHKHTQDYIGRKFNLNRSLISKYEKGHTVISTTFLIEYTKLYHISTDYLLGKIDKEIIIKEFIPN